MDRSTRNLSLITLIVVVIFLALNFVARSAPLSDWTPVLILLLIALAIWGYDRLSRRGVDDSEAADTEIEPITYERPILAAASPGAMYQQAEPSPSAPVADVLIPAPSGATTAVPRTEPLVAPPPAVPTAPASPEASTPAEEEPAPPEPEQHPPAAAPETTTIEEKSAPPPSAPAPETDPEQAAHAPDGLSLPAVPVDDASGRPATLSKPTEGTAPEPKAGKRGKGKKAAELDVSATPLANAAPASTLPINADPAKPDDLKVIEGIGPKMEKALHAAGITTFAQLSGASEGEINAAILAAGMRFAPSVPTWAEQASYAANGDFVGLETYQKTLSGGRKAK
ncbi:MAG: hypothetical protein LCI00_14030 [Chloroflexi bacterium]|nr:hypothetical protein [Chloroflexota bacterium]MCC6892216.1 hypothetical protein [Anaerolineae bacterium]